MDELPFLTAGQMREVDRLLVDEYGIDLIQMMENAGRNLAALARDRFLDGDPRGRRIAVLAGPGGNGGGGLVAARRLMGWGAEITIWLSQAPERFASVPGRQLAILRKLDADVRLAGGAMAIEADLILDALIGYSLSGAPRGAAATLIEAANAADAPVLSLDLPSGLDATADAVHVPAITADATMTLALPKSGLQPDEAHRHVGELYLADIGVPPGLYAGPSLRLEVGPIFAESEIIRVW